jgi:DNA-binding MarR family transcriptional regulator
METREYSLRNIVFLAKRLRKQLWNEVETQVAIEGVSALQWSVLSGIATGQGDSVSDLSQTFDHDPGALSRSVNQLVEKGLLSYVPRTDDRRRISLQITDEGKRVFESLKERIHHATGAIRGTLSEEEFCQLEALLAKANAAIENLGLASA